MKRTRKISASSWAKKTHLLSLLLIVFLFSTTPETRDDPVLYEHELQQFFSGASWKTGDLLFRRGKSLSSQAVLLSDRETDYSHVGFVYVINGRPYVIHAVPGENGTGADRLRCEPALRFLSYMKASRAALYRIRSISEEKARTAASWAVSAYLRGAVFDDAYDLKSDSRLYCTELLWKSFRAAGIDLVGSRFDNLSVPTIPSRIILPGTLIRSSEIRKIISF